MEKKIGKFVNWVLGYFGYAIHTITVNTCDIVQRGEGVEQKDEKEGVLAGDDRALNEQDDPYKEFIAKNQWIQKKGFRSVLDIGANEGQFAEKFSMLLPEAEFHCFEPLKDPFDALKEKFAENENFHFYQMALGSIEGISEFFRNEYSPSSSLLPMKQTHKDAFDFARAEYAESVSVRKLEDVLGDIPMPYLVKIDVQGYESQVISGGRGVIEKADMIILETSFVQLYQNAPLFDSIYKQLLELGFVYAGSFEQLFSPKDGSIMQQDSIFIRV